MLSYQIIDLRRSYIILEYLAKIMRGYEDEQKKQSAKIEGFEKRFDTVDTKLTSVEKEVKNHSKELIKLNDTLDIVAQEVMNHSKEFYQVHKKLATFDAKFEAIDANFDKIIAHFGI